MLSALQVKVIISAVKADPVQVQQDIVAVAKRHLSRDEYATLEAFAKSLANTLMYEREMEEERVKLQADYDATVTKAAAAKRRKGDR